MSTYKNVEFSHSQPEKIGVLLVNLGTPKDCDTQSVKAYLKQFLSDPRVVEAPRLLWSLFLNIILLNTRPKRSAKAYQKVWTDNGSPLLHISKLQAQGLQQALNSEQNSLFHVELAMTYGEPDIPSAIKKLQEINAAKVLVFPLYPQYSATTTAATFDAIVNELKCWRLLPELRFINHYHDHAEYITTLAASIKRYWQNHPPAEKLILSFHGLPQEYHEKGDPYFCECQKTGRLLAEALRLNKDQWKLTFQSRLGPKQWLTPYTDKTLEDLAKNQNVKSVQVVCPGFSADCLETLEEVAMENRDIFLENGGEQYEYIECLNDSSPHIQMMKNLIHQHTANWSEPTEEHNKQLELREQKAQALKS